MTTEPVRDFIGYGGNPPDPQWPNEARLAVNFVMNFEEGSEPSFADGDNTSEAALTEVGPQGVKGRDLAAESQFEYGSRVGFWRIHRIFQERQLPLTVFGCALALERNPPAATAIAQAGYDVCCHGYRWEKHYEMDIDVERGRIAKAIASLQKSVGTRPLGWYCRYGPSLNTRLLLVDEGGFLYDSDGYNDELPYWVRVSGRSHLVVPYTLGVNDSKYARAMFGTGNDFFTYAKDALDLMLREGAIIVGAYGDRAGRKAALVFTVGLMGLATGLVAFLPGSLTVEEASHLTRVLDGYANAITTFDLVARVEALEGLKRGL